MKRLMIMACLLLMAATPAVADTTDSTAVKPPREQEWGLGMAVRSSNIVFNTSARDVATLVPSNNTTIIFFMIVTIPQV